MDSNHTSAALLLPLPSFRHIFKEHLHLYHTKKVFIIQTKLKLFFLSLSGEQWNRTICHKARSTLAGCPYHHQGLLSKVQTLSIISPPTQSRTGKPITEHHILSVTSLPNFSIGGLFEPSMGFEPTTYWLQISCTTIVLRWQKLCMPLHHTAITTLKNSWSIQIRTEDATAKKLCVTTTP